MKFGERFPIDIINFFKGGIVMNNMKFFKEIKDLEGVEKVEKLYEEEEECIGWTIRLSNGKSVFCLFTEAGLYNVSDGGREWHECSYEEAISIIKALSRGKDVRGKDVIKRFLLIEVHYGRVLNAEIIEETESEVRGRLNRFISEARYNRNHRSDADYGDIVQSEKGFSVEWTFDGFDGYDYIGAESGGMYAFYAQ
jgi:hypothetical protein